jgi:hypothetical protein
LPISFECIGSYAVLGDGERVTYNLSARRNNGGVTFLVDYWDPREPRWLTTAIEVALNGLPVNERDARESLLARVVREVGGINDAEALAVCGRLVDEMLLEIGRLQA